MIKKLENDHLTVEINETGAELFSIKSNKTGLEYLWQGNPKYWKDRSPVLFPICGRLFNDKYTYENQEFKMPMHGISRLFDFSSKVIKNNILEFELRSNDKTKGYYPFDFVFIVKYTLKKNLIRTEFIVKNTGEKDMYFSYGAHPGFNVPFIENDVFDNYYLEFNKSKMKKLLFSKTGFFLNKTEKFTLNEKKLNLSYSMFEEDGVFFESTSDKIKLKSYKSKNSIEVMYKNMTCVGVWQMAKVNAPYICIEPWHGIPSSDGIVDDLRTKQQTIKLKAKKIYANSYIIKIVEK